jgi:hypothetical protein
MNPMTNAEAPEGTGRCLQSCRDNVSPHHDGMASSSKNGSSLRKPTNRPDEAWKTAPGRETTHDDPEGRDVRIATERRRLENAPGLIPKKDEDDQ